MASAAITSLCSRTSSASDCRFEQSRRAVLRRHRSRFERQHADESCAPATEPCAHFSKPQIRRRVFLLTVGSRPHSLSDFTADFATLQNRVVAARADGTPLWSIPCIWA